MEKTCKTSQQRLLPVLWETNILHTRNKKTAGAKNTHIKGLNIDIQHLLLKLKQHMIILK